MKKLVLKELREHFKVALLGGVLLTVMMVLAFRGSAVDARQAFYFHSYGRGEGLQPLLSKLTLIEAAFFCGAFGALLGWLQARSEGHPDLWAFLVHRPISRGTIFKAKLAGGVLLYLGGAAPPLLGLVVAAAIPGNVAAPFAWAMGMPLAAICLSGLVFHLAGLLTGLRQARWYASRGYRNCKAASPSAI